MRTTYSAAIQVILWAVSGAAVCAQGYKVEADWNDENLHSYGFWSDYLKSSEYGALGGGRISNRMHRAIGRKTWKSGNAINHWVTAFDLIWAFAPNTISPNYRCNYYGVHSQVWGRYWYGYSFDRTYVLRPGRWAEWVGTNSVQVKYGIRHFRYEDQDKRRGFHNTIRFFEDQKHMSMQVTVQGTVECEVKWADWDPNTNVLPPNDEYECGKQIVFNFESRFQLQTWDNLQKRWWSTDCDSRRLESKHHFKTRTNLYDRVNAQVVSDYKVIKGSKVEHDHSYRRRPLKTKGLYGTWWK